MATYGKPSLVEKKEDHLYYAEYANGLNSDAAYDYFSKYGSDLGFACSAISKGALVGRNLDWFYSEDVDVIVKTPHTKKTKAVLGTSGAVKGVTKELMEDGDYDLPIFDIVPFQLQDGINENGLFACINVVPHDYKNTVIEPIGVFEREISSLMLVRFILDNFATASDAVYYLKNHARITFPAKLLEMGYECHYMIRDLKNTFIVEFIDNKIVTLNVTEDHPFITNFHRYGVTLNNDGSVSTPESGDPIEDNNITKHGMGLERHNIINADYANIEDSDDVRDTLDKLLYTHMYSSSESPADPFWYSEYVSGDLIVSSPLSDFSESVTEGATEYTNRDRSDPVTWITTHSAIYDLENLTMDIRAQENSTSYEITLEKGLLKPSSRIERYLYAILKK